MIHLLVILFLLWISHMGISLASNSKEKAEDPEETVVLLSPEYFQLEEVQPEAKKKKYLDTNPEIKEETPAEETEIIGAKSTIASSETPLDEGDKTLPTQLVREDHRKKTLETYDSEYNEGELDTPASISVSESAPESSPEVTALAEQVESLAQADAPVEDMESEAAKEESPAMEETIQSSNQIEVEAKKVVEELNEKPAVEEAKAPSTDGTQAVTKQLPKPKPKKVTQSDPGFRSQKSKTRIIGSLSRDGKSALNVKKTALGQYYSTISKIIEREWQKNCLQYREHIQPGVIAMQFYVDANGKISNPKPYDVVATSPIQQGFTIKAIRHSKLPKMPEAAKKELGHEKLELIYNFYF